jgi:hypothetical protein
MLPKKRRENTPHPALSPGIGGEGKGEGENRREDEIHRR